MKKLITAFLFAGLTARASLFIPAEGLLNPTSGNLTGLPGQTVIWGIDLTNDTNDWWVITSVQSDYNYTGIAGGIPDGPNFFTDYLSPYFLNNWVENETGLAPGQTVQAGGGSSARDQPQLGTPGVDGVGLASFAISPTALPGAVSAQIHITYDIYDGNPFDDVDPGNYLGSDQIDLNTSVTVLSATPTPEPGTTALIAAALGICAIMRRRNRRLVKTAPC